MLLCSIEITRRLSQKILCELIDCWMNEPLFADGLGTRDEGGQRRVSGGKMVPCQGRSVSRWGWTSLFTWSTIWGVVKEVIITAPSSIMACFRAGISEASMRRRVGLVAEGMFTKKEKGIFNKCSCFGVEG